jgi:hypothetical protein
VSISSTYLCATFTHADPKSVKKAVKSTVIFELPGSMCLKGAHKNFGEIADQGIYGEIELKELAISLHDR